MELIKTLINLTAASGTVQGSQLQEVNQQLSQLVDRMRLIQQQAA